MNYKEIRDVVAENNGIGNFANYLREHRMIEAKAEQDVNNNQTTATQFIVYRVDISGMDNNTPATSKTPHRGIRVITWGLEKQNDEDWPVNLNGPNKNMKVLALDQHNTYASVSELPDWMQGKIAILNSIDASQETEEIEGIGRRVSATVFWVYPAEHERLEAQPK